MSKRFLLSIVLVLIITNITTLLFWNQNDDDTNIDMVEQKNGKKIKVEESVATIGKEDITYEAWQSALQAEYGEMGLKKLIDRAVVKNLAKQRNIHINEKVIEHGVSLLFTMTGVMTAEEAAITEEKWREDVLYRYQLEALLAENIEVSEDEIQRFYEGYGKQYEFTASLQFSHIIVNDFETANKIMQELDDGASFNLLAQEYSVDEDTRDVGGYLGYFTSTSQFIPAGYYAKAMDMAENSYSEPFQTGEGVAIVYLHRHLPGISFTYDELKGHIKNELALKEYEQILTADPLWEELGVEWMYE